MNNERIFINDIDILQYGARALRNTIKVGGTPVTNDYFQGRNRSSYVLMSTTFALKPVSFSLVFSDTHLRKALENKSIFEAQAFGGCELHLPDGFYYKCMLDTIGDADTKGVDGDGVIVECNYKFLGIQHDEMITVADGTSFIAKGTLPRMDCILSVTVGANAASYTLGGAVFSNVVAGDVLVVDGINKRFLKNGAPTTATNWLAFPYVTSGLNAFTATDTVTVQYYPCYI